jgi:agmatinase
MSTPKTTQVLGSAENFLGIGKDISTFASSKILVLPAPYEQTVSYGGGTRKGPRAILKASQYVEHYDEELDRELCRDVGIATLPPLQFRNRRDEKAVEDLYRAAKRILAADKFLVTLGGEHTISLAPIRAYLEKYPDLSVLQFDAHSDLRDTYQKNKYSHACVMARVCEIVDPRRIVQVGIRAQCTEEAQFIRQRGIHTFYAHHIRGGLSLAKAVLPHLTEHVYVTFDVDGFDPSVMPSTGTPEPNGLVWQETMELLRAVAEQMTIVGCDVVEFAPISGLHYPDISAAKLTYKLMNYAFMVR